MMGMAAWMVELGRAGSVWGQALRDVGRKARGHAGGMVGALELWGWDLMGTAPGGSRDGACLRSQG